MSAAAAIVNTAESRGGASVPVLEYDFAGGGQSLALTAAAAFSAELTAGRAYLIVSTEPCFFSVMTAENPGVGASDPKSTFLAAGIPFHLFVSDPSRASVRRAGDEDGRVFITRIKSR